MNGKTVESRSPPNVAESTESARSESSNTRTMAKQDKQRFRRLYRSVFKGKTQGQPVNPGSQGLGSFLFLSSPRRENASLGWIYSDEAWRKSLRLRVDADWLEKQILNSTLAQLNQDKAAVHALLMRLVKSIQGVETPEDIERTNAMEALGVVIEGKQL